MVGCGAILGVGGAGFSYFTFLNKKKRIDSTDSSKNRVKKKVFGTAPQILTKNQELGAMPNGPYISMGSSCISVDP
jgi:hypothetical protein